MTNLEAAGYMVQDKQGNAIFGVGQTLDDAWAMVVEGAGPFFDAYGEPKDDEAAFLEGFTAYGATQALIDRVAEIGGAIGWEVVGGIACTEEEAEG